MPPEPQVLERATPNDSPHVSQEAATPHLSAKRWWVTLLLAAIPHTGMFGVHRFYVGKVRSGVLMASFTVVLGGAILLVLFAVIAIALLLGADPGAAVDAGRKGTDALLIAFLNKYGFLVFPFCLVQLVWWIVDLTRIVRGSFTDAAGRPVTRR